MSASYEEVIAATTAGALLGALGDDGMQLPEQTLDAINAALNDDTPMASAGTIADLEQAVKDTPNAGVVFFAPSESATVDATLMNAVAAPTMVFADQAVVKAAMPSTVDTLVLANTDGNEVSFTGTKDVNVTLGTGNNNQVTTAGGDDIVTFQGGTATIDTGAGADEVYFMGDNGKATIESTEGELTLFLQTTSGAATINAGEGFDKLVTGVVSGRGDHTFEIVNGKVVMHSAEMTMSNMDLVVFDSGSDAVKNAQGYYEYGQSDNMTIISHNEGDTLVARLYQIAYGRQPFDGPQNSYENGNTLAGIKWWMDEFENQTDDHSLQHLVYSFLNVAEFHNKFDSMTDHEYVTTLYAQLAEGGNVGTTVSTVNGFTVDQYVAALESGDMNRWDVAWQVAASDQAEDILGIDGSQYVIEVPTDNA